MTYKYICQEYFCEYKCGCIQPKPPEEDTNQSVLIYFALKNWDCKNTNNCKKNGLGDI